MKPKAFCFAFLCAFALNATDAAEVIPPAPLHYFNDYAGLVSQSAADQFDRQLEQFESETSDQVVVAIFPKMQSDDDVAAYTQRVAQSWAVGQKTRRNGVVLFVFVQDRKMFIQVGYGLEGALPDVAAFNITESQIKPKFAAADYEGGLRAGIDAICAAIGGEYSGNHQIAPEHEPTRHVIGPLLFGIFFIFLSLVGGLRRKNRGYGISSKGSGWTIDWGNVFFFWLSLLLSSSSRGSGGSSSSGGGFSGGGGSFGGGGAGSSW